MDFKSDDTRIWLEDAEGREVAFLEFAEEAPGVVNILHTVVDDSLAGRGIAGELNKAGAERLRAEGKKAVLSCSYSVRWFAKHPEYSDVVYGAEESTEKKDEP